MLGNIGSVELFVIMVTILLVFGAKRIPEIARALGSGIREFREAGRAIKNEFRLDEDVQSDRTSRAGRQNGPESRAERRSTAHRTERPREGGIVPPMAGDPPVMPESSEDASSVPS
jgi:TatA/E family protein of Tat protein translocase